MKRKNIFGIALAMLFSLSVFVPAALADVYYNIGGMPNDATIGSGGSDGSYAKGWELSETSPGVYTLTLNSNYTGDRVYLWSGSSGLDTLYVVIDGDVSIDIDGRNDVALAISTFGNVHINGSSSASSTSSLKVKNSSGEALGIISSTQTYIGDTKGFSLTANANVPDDYGVTGIGVDGNLRIGDPSAGNMVVSASAENQGVTYVAYGITCTGSLVINDGAKVTATGDSKNNKSTGIYAENTGSVIPAILIQSGSDVTAEGKGPNGSGLVAVKGKVEIAAAATVKAIAHGSGYSIGADEVTGGSSLVKLTADDSDHYFKSGTDTSGLSQNVKYAYNSSGSGSSGGCDAGFAPSGIAALVMVFFMKKSRKPR